MISYFRDFVFAISLPETFLPWKIAWFGPSFHSCLCSNVVLFRGPLWLIYIKWHTPSHGSALLNHLYSTFSDGGLVAKFCPTLVTPWTVAFQGSFVHGISQARILECVAISFSRGSSLPRDPTQVSCIAVGVFANSISMIYMYLFFVFIVCLPPLAENSLAAALQTRCYYNISFANKSSEICRG